MKYQRTRRLLAFCVVVACLLSPFTLAVGAAPSGNLDEAAHSRADIAKKYAAITKPSTIFKTKPSIKKTYKAGSLQTGFLNSGLDYLNFVRYLAKLPAVKLSKDLNTQAQHGAVLLAATQDFSHTPAQPSDMPDAFYKQGYAATTGSNLSFQWGFNTKDSLMTAVQSCMEDADNSNIDRVGHRRWFLNPTLQNVGFGYAEDARGASYVVSQVFDESGDDVDYDYVAWPSSGYFPNEVFPIYTPWSVTLNPAVYKTPNAKKVTVQLTRLSDGKVWKFYDGCDEDDYFNVNTDEYGVSNCIIFRPDYADFEGGDMNGRYMVKIGGIYTKKGKAATVEYEVDFFDMDTYKSLNIAKQPKNATVEYGKTATISVSALGSGLKYQWYIKDSGTSKWTKSSVKTNKYSFEMTKAKSGRQAFCVITDTKGNVVVSRTVTLTMKMPYIIKQPQNATADVGKYATADLQAGGTDISYSWYIKNPDSAEWVKSAVTSRNYSFIMSPEKSGRQAYCIIKDKDGNTTKSDTVTLSMTKPEITKQPSDVTAPAGTEVSVSVKATGKKLTYQWYYKHSYSSKFLKSTAKTATYSFKLSSSNTGRQVYCVITDQYGQQVKTDTVTFRVAKLKITQQPKSATVASGKTAKATVKATGEGLTYQWYYKNPGTKTFRKSSITTATYSYTMNSSKSGREVYCVITDQYGQTVKTKTITFKKA